MVWDLIVVGGGLTGVAAAVSAARQGVKVLVVEKSGALGGALNTCLVNPYMRYWTTLNGARHELSRGIFTEINKRLEALGGLNDTIIHEEYMKLTLDRLVTEAGAEVLFHAVLCGVHIEDARVASISVASKAGALTLEARAFIDCTGDADLAFQCGCPFRLGRPEDGLCQPMTLCFRVANVDMPLFRAHRGEINAKYQELQARGVIKNPRENVLIFGTAVDNMLHFNTTRVIKYNPTDPFDVTRAEMLAREQMFEMFDFLKRYIPGFEHSDIAYSAQDIGVRESRMIDGEYVLTEQDLKACVKFEDRIAAGNYDIDIHNPAGSGTSHYYFPEGAWYTIPYRALVPRGVCNLLVSGRCISVTHEAQASIRIMPIVATLGEAAGTAAAVALESAAPMRQADVSEIQRRLVNAGAYIG